jgi:hypothetical protein
MSSIPNCSFIEHFLVVCALQVTFDADLTVQPILVGRPKSGERVVLRRRHSFTDQAATTSF